MNPSRAAASALAETGDFRVKLTVTNSDPIPVVIYEEYRDVSSIGAAFLDPSLPVPIPSCIEPVSFTVVLPHDLYNFTLTIDTDGTTGDVNPANNTVYTFHHYDL